MHAYSLNYTLHACGSLCSHKGKTPLLCAAEAGHDEIVAYLLEFREVQTYLKEQSEKVQNANVSCNHNLHVIIQHSLCRASVCSAV